MHVPIRANLTKSSLIFAFETKLKKTEIISGFFLKKKKIKQNLSFKISAKDRGQGIMY